MRALVILPTYNELANLAPLVETILEQGDMFDILVVDDGSPDGTGILADHLKVLYPGRVEVIHRQGKLGIATAYLTGFHYGLTKGYEYCFEMDADFSHNPEYLPKFIDAIAESGADLVLGSRYVDGGGVENWPWYRQLISRSGSTYARVLLGLNIHDVTGGFKCFSRALLEALPLDQVQSTGYSFQIEMTYRAIQAGFKVVEIPIVFAERKAGVSKMSPAIFLEAFWMVTQMRALSLFKDPSAEPAGHRVRS